MKGQFDFNFFRFNLLFLVFYFCLIFDSKAQLANSPWPVESHDGRRSGQSQYNGVHFNNLKWSYSTSGNVSSVVIGLDGTIYFGSEDKHLYALNPDGTLKWKFNTGGEVSSPAISLSGTIYFGSEDNHLYAVNSDGSLKWKFQTRLYNSAFRVKSPTIGLDGTVYILSWDKYIYAINSDGTLKWKYYVNTGWGANVAIGPAGTIYLVTISNSSPYPYDRIYALNPDDGTLKWIRGARGTPAIASDGTIYVGSMGRSDKHIRALNPDGTLKWKYKTKISSPPAIGNDGTIYFGNYGSYGFNDFVRALNPDGTIKWSTSIEGSIYDSPAIGSDGIIYVGSRGEGYFYALNPDGTIKWKYKRDFYTSPAISSDGSIYVGSFSTICAFGKFSGPKIMVENPNINFGSVLLGYCRTINLRVTNGGDMPLYVTNIASNMDNFVAFPNSFTIPVDSTKEVQVIFTPTSLNTVNSQIQISSNDPNNPNLNVSISGSGINLYIADVSILNVTTSSILLKWTSPGNESFGNKAKEYDIRFYKSQIDTSNWDLATKAQNPPIPQIAGSFQYSRVESLNVNTSYFIAMKASDDGANWSDISNVVSATTNDSIADISWKIENIHGGLSFDLASLALDTDQNPHIAYYGANQIYYAYCSENIWSSDTVNYENDIESISLALDYNKHPHIIYCSNDELKYINFDGYVWKSASLILSGHLVHSSLFIDTAGNPSFCYYDEDNNTIKYVYYNGSNWQFLNVAENTDKLFSFVLDSNNKPHISYYDPTQKKIKYTSYDGLSWNFSVVDLGMVKPYTSLSIDNDGNPHITYCTFTETCDYMDEAGCQIEGPDLPNLKYAYHDGNSWIIDNLESTTGKKSILSLDSDGDPYIIYYKGERECTNYVPFLGCISTAVKLKSTNLVYKEGNDWQKKFLYDVKKEEYYLIDSKGNIHYCSTTDGSLKYNLYVTPSWQETQIVHSKEQVGGSNSIALDNYGNPHISYRDATNENLKYTHYNGLSWKTETIVSTELGGSATSIAIDKNNYPHISHVKNMKFFNSSLEYTFYNGISWKTETIDSTVGSTSQIALDKNDNPHISYNSRVQNSIKYAHYNGTSWKIETIDSLPALWYSKVSLVLDENDNPHISYIEYIDIGISTLKYAYYNGSSWKTEPIIQDSKSLSGISIAIDNFSNNPFISFFNDGYLKFALYDSLSWQIYNIDIVRDGDESSLVFKNYIPHIAYSNFNYNSSTGGTGGLRYAFPKNDRWCIFDIDIKTNSFSLAIDDTDHPHISYYDYDGNFKYLNNPVLTEVESSPEQHNELPSSFKIYHNFPNPFNPNTTIRYELPKFSKVKLIIYNVLGQRINTIVDVNQAPGVYTIKWDGKDNYGILVSSGIYFCRLQAGDFVKTIKMMALH